MVSLRRSRGRTIVRVNRPPFMSFFNGVMDADDLLRAVEEAGQVDEFIVEPVILKKDGGGVILTISFDVRSDGVSTLIVHVRGRQGKEWVESSTHLILDDDGRETVTVTLQSAVDSYAEAFKDNFPYRLIEDGEPYTEGLVSRGREIGLFTAIRKSLTE